jgi:hypothetical protein|tara:strand:+ start:3483 stop:3653 length:171 start_codon:yes stop_codon:yes gene_type:complete
MRARGDNPAARSTPLEIGDKPVVANVAGLGLPGVAAPWPFGGLSEVVLPVIIFWKG